MLSHVDPNNKYPQVGVNFLYYKVTIEIQVISMTCLGQKHSSCLSVTDMCSLSVLMFNVCSLFSLSVLVRVTHL